MKKFFLRDLFPGKLKKNDYIILVLLGVLLLVVAIPSGTGSKKKVQKEPDTQLQDKSGDEYVKSLEGRLEDMLGQMAGVGKVKVMITVRDNGEEILDKNTKRDNDKYEQETVLYEMDDVTKPHVTSECMPEIEGIMIVAEGGDEPGLQRNISEAVMALFNVEMHKIKIVKMTD